jgi:hypothetical protein
VYPRPYSTLCIPAAPQASSSRPRGLSRPDRDCFDLLRRLRSEDEGSGTSCRGRVVSLPISGPRSAFTASLSTKAQYETQGAVWALRSCGSPRLLRPVTRCRTHAAPLETHRLAISHVSRHYLDMPRFDWDERKNKSNRSKHRIWFEEAQSVFSDRMHAYFMIRSTPSTRIGSFYLV